MSVFNHLSFYTVDDLYVSESFLGGRGGGINVSQKLNINKLFSSKLKSAGA